MWRSALIHFGVIFITRLVNQAIGKCVLVDGNCNKILKDKSIPVRGKGVVDAVHSTTSGYE